MKKILGVCCIVGMISSANAFPTGIYECKADKNSQNPMNIYLEAMTPMEFELQSDSKASMRSTIDGTRMPASYGYWEDRGDKALVINKKTVLIKRGDKYFLDVGGMQIGCIKKK